MLFSGHCAKKVSIKFPTKLYKNGHVRTFLATDAGQEHQIHCGKDKQKFNDLKNVRSFSIVAELTGGLGNEAWQHTQLFRQDLSDHSCPFYIRIKLSDKC